MLALIPLISQGLGLAGKFIKDKDKQAEYAFKSQEMLMELAGKALSIQTYKWVDAIVKIMAALISFGRPVGGFVLTVWGIWLHIEGADIPEVVHYSMDAAFPAWGAAREAGKKREHKERKGWFGRRNDDD